MDKLIIRHVLVPAPSIDVFRVENGQRRLRMPYWLKAKEALVFDFIDQATNVQKLQELINEGIVWVREEDASSPLSIKQIEI